MPKLKPVLRIHHPLIFNCSEKVQPIDFEEYKFVAESVHCVEFGFGKGSFIIKEALNNPKLNFLGVEAVPSLFFSALKKAAKHNLPNLYFALGDARLIFSYYLQNAQLERAYFLFPDPWHKTKHFNRRMISESSSPYLINTLKEGSEIIIRSDNHIVLFDALICLVNAGCVVSKIEENFSIQNAMTDWEVKAINSGRKIFQVNLKKVSKNNFSILKPLFDERQIGLRIINNDKIVYSGAVTDEHKKMHPEVMLPNSLLK